MNYNATLYYPTIEFRDKKWLWNACLLWDKVYRIVPEGYTPDDRREVREIIENGDIISDICPTKYASEMYDDFARDMEQAKWSAALAYTDYVEGNYARLHEGKADVQLRELLIAGNKKDNEGFFNVSREFANTYMIYLAKYIAQTNNMTVATDYDFAWICSNFLDYHGNLDDDVNRGQNLAKLGSLTFADFLPYGIENLTANELLSFRKNSKDERHIFFKEMQTFADAILHVNDEKVILDIVHEQLQEYQKAKAEYVKRMRDIKIESFLGVKSLMFPAVTTALAAFLSMPDEVSKMLGLAGVCCGVIGGIHGAKQKLSVEAEKYSVNYLMQLKHQLPYYYYQDYYRKFKRTYLQGYHDYLNDRINEFIYD